MGVRAVSACGRRTSGHTDCAGPQAAHKHHGQSHIQRHTECHAERFGERHAENGTLRQSVRLDPLFMTDRDPELWLTAIPNTRRPTKVERRCMNRSPAPAKVKHAAKRSICPRRRSQPRGADIRADRVASEYRHRSSKGAGAIAFASPAVGIGSAPCVCFKSADKGSGNPTSCGGPGLRAGRHGMPAWKRPGGDAIRYGAANTLSWVARIIAIRCAAATLANAAVNGCEKPQVCTGCRSMRARSTAIMCICCSRFDRAYRCRERCRISKDAACTNGGRRSPRFVNAIGVSILGHAVPGRSPAAMSSTKLGLRISRTQSLPRLTTTFTSRRPPDGGPIRPRRPPDGGPIRPRRPPDGGPIRPRRPPDGGPIRL